MVGQSDGWTIWAGQEGAHSSTTVLTSAAAAAAAACMPSLLSNPDQYVT